jgi:Undecaprenyl-phosphate glucose phosphotransferase
MNAFSKRDLRPVQSASRPQPTSTGPAARSELLEDLAKEPKRPRYSTVVLSGLVRAAEFLIIILTAAIVHGLYVAPAIVRHGYTAPAIGYEPAYFIIATAVAGLSLLAFQMLQTYHPTAFRQPMRQVVRISTGWSLVFLIVFAAIFFLKLDGVISRVWIASWFLLGLAAFIVERAVLARIALGLVRSGRLDRRTVVVGGGEFGRDLLRDLAAARNSEIQMLGVFDDRSDDRSPDTVEGFPKLGNVDDLVDFARQTRIDLVIFALPITAEQRILEMLRKLWVLPIDVRLAAHANRLRFRPRSYSYVDQVPVLDLLDKPIADWDVVIKLAFDKVVGTLALMALSPILLATALAVKLDSPGPVLFRQKRYGFNNELIEVFKFRSMYVDQTDATAVKLVTKNDPRVTRVGRFIRKTSLDELPQLLNVVLKGNLSLVGPRPHAVHAKAADRLYDEVVDGYFARHRVRPGITGWAQVNGWRGETDTPEKIQGRVEHDLHYIENWSIIFDLYILAVTPYSLIKTKNAY